MSKSLFKVFSAITILALVLMALPMGSAGAAGSVSLTTLGSAYVEDFNTLASSGTSSTVPNGWDFAESGTNANALYTAGTGSSNTGDTYSFGASDDTERAFGGLLSGSLNPTIGASFTNNTGSTITQLEISYTGEQWRLGTSGRTDRLDFQYSLDATSLTTGSWANVDNLDFNGPISTGTVGLLDGNSAANRSSISATIPDLNIADGATFWIRWTDFNASGSDDGLAVDDFSLTPNGSGEEGQTNIIITEIMYDPNSAEDNWEWIEIYNAGTSSVDLTGFVVDDNNSVSHSAANVAGGTLAAGQQAVLYNVDDVSTADFTAAWGSVNLIPVTNWAALALNNTGDQLSLWKSFADYSGDHATHANAIDTVTFNSGVGFPDPVGASIYLTDLGADNNIGSNWAASTVGGGTPLFSGYQSSAAGGNLGTDIGSPGTPGTLAEIIINEVDADTPGDDSAEFIELYDGGVGNADLSGLVVVFYNGSNDQSYAAFDLDGYVTDGEGYFVLGNPGVTNVDLTFSPGAFGALQNGADAVALFTGDVASFPTGTAVTTNNLIDALVYDTNDSDDTGLLTLLNAGQPQVDEAGGGDSAGQSNQRCPNGSGGARNTDTYSQGSPTPGAANDCAPPPPPLSCESTLTLTAIHDIQGSGASTSMSGQEVIIEGVVVGDFQANDSDAGDLAGFYVQEEDSQADGSSLTSEGIFVFDLGSSVNVQAGDIVRVLGNVNEFQNQTQVNAGAVVVCGSGQGGLVSPTAILFPLPNGQADLEQYEGMLVTTDQPMTVIEYFNLDRFGTVDVATERLETPTDAAEPGSASDAVLAYNNARRIRLDDGSQTQNPFPVTLPDGQLEYGDAFGGGDTLSNIVGVLSWIRPWTGAQPEGYAIQLTHLPTFENTNPRPADPPQVGGSFKVVGFNVLNYFNGNGMGGGFPTSRGATDPAEFQKQTTKIVAALAALDADVVGLIEIENDFADGANSAIADLVDALNAATAPGTYAYIDPGSNVGSDEITVAIIYKPATATPVGDLAILDSPDFVNPFNAEVDRNRPALAQTFMSVETGGVMTVVVNHLKSKGSGCGPNDDDPRQGSCNLTRTASAQVLVDWLATDPTSSGDADFLLIGDYNSYAKEDPIDVFTDAGYVDLFALFQPEDVYSYVFDGMTGYLDYGIASPTLVGQVTGAAPWNINSDEPDAFEYDEEFDHPSNLPLWYAPTAYRSSDHDPVVVGLDLLQYGFDGFFPPIDNVPTVNTVKAGQAVPIKFSLSGDLGLDVFFDGYPTFEFGSCDPSSGDPVEETVPDSNSGLTYDPVTNEYTFVWKTERSWANKCGTLTIVFDDGTVRNILFRFTR